MTVEETEETVMPACELTAEEMCTEEEETVAGWDDVCVEDAPAPTEDCAEEAIDEAATEEAAAEDCCEETAVEEADAGLLDDEEPGQMVHVHEPLH